MKQGTIIVRIMTIVLFVCIAAYFVVYLWDSTTKNTATATLYTFVAEERINASGYFFRDEEVLTQSSDMTEVLAAEGEKMGVGDVVARVYENRDGYAIQQELDEAEAALESLNYIYSRTGNLGASASLDGDIVDSFTSLKARVALGDMGGLSQATGELKSYIFRRDYSFSGVDSLTEEIAETERKVASLTQQASTAYHGVTAPVAGLFSSSVDGYEGVLNLEELKTISPSKLDELAKSNKNISGNEVGKIITNNGWFFACNINTNQTKKLYSGASANLRFENSTRIFEASVYSVSAEEDGRVTIVFYSESYPAMVTNMRGEQVEIITGGASGLRVPKRSVRVLDDGTIGIYRVSGARVDWVDIDILWEADDFYLIQQTPKVDEDGNQVRESDFDKATALRDGDVVIVKGEALYDGKVIA